MSLLQPRADDLLAKAILLHLVHKRIELIELQTYDNKSKSKGER